MLEGVPLMKIMKEAKDFPAEREAAKDRLIIAKKLRRTTGDRICNYRKAAKQVESTTNFDDWNDCPCRKLFDKKYRPGHGCVLTMDTTIARNKTLIKLLNEGTRYREDREVDSQAILAGALGGFIERMAFQLNVDRDLFSAWKLNDLNTTREQLLPPKVGLRSILDNPVVKHRLKFLLKHLVLVPTDKAAKNFAFICRRHYQKVLNDELNSNDGAYAECDLNKINIFDTFQGELY